MAADDRFYQMSLSSRPLWWGDLGNRFQLSGFVLEGEKTLAIVLSPNSSADSDALKQAKVIAPNTAEWWEIIKASDDPSVFILDATGGIKAIHRKMRYAISGAVQQKVWARDGFKCLYCGQPMGKVQLSIDHFNPLEMGGSDAPENYASACRRDNKTKGSIPARQWCETKGISYDAIIAQMQQPLP